MDIWYDGTHAMTIYEYGGDENPLKRVIGHTWKTWGFVPTACPTVAPPNKKETTMDVPGSNGSIDLTELLIGYPLYENREGSWSFYLTEYTDALLDNNDLQILDNLDDPILASENTDWASFYTKVLNRIHCKHVAIILDDDPNYYWEGYLKVSQWDKPADLSANGVTIEYKLYPYKKEKEHRIIDLYPVELDTWVNIPCGAMPVVLEYSTHISAATNVAAQYNYENEELGIVVGTSSGAAYNTNDAYKILYSNVSTRMPIIISNLSGYNLCRIKKISMSSSTTVIKIRYRVGEL